VEKSGLLRVNLKVEVRDKHGKLVDVREKESDLILDNFKDLLAVIMNPYVEIIGGERINASLVNTGGGVANLAVICNIAVAAGQGHTYICADNATEFRYGMRIGIGTSTVSPTRGDYTLGAWVATGTPTQTVGADYISWAVSIVLEAAADIAEAGLVATFNIGFATTPDYFSFLLFRDTFTPISVPAGGTISVTYTLSL